MIVYHSKTPKLFMLIDPTTFLPESKEEQPHEYQNLLTGVMFNMFLLEAIHQKHKKKSV